MTISSSTSIAPALLPLGIMWAPNVLKDFVGSTLTMVSW